MAKDTIELSPAHQQVWTLDLCGTKLGLYQRATTLGEFPCMLLKFSSFFSERFSFLFVFVEILMHFKAFGFRGSFSQLFYKLFANWGWLLSGIIAKDVTSENNLGLKKHDVHNVRVAEEWKQTTLWWSKVEKSELLYKIMEELFMTFE